MKKKNLFQYRAGFKIIIIMVIAFLPLSCASNKPHQIDLMPAPDVYTSGEVDPFEGLPSIETAPYRGILYATDRMPDRDSENFYKNERGNVLRLGIGKIESGDKDFTWEEARKISLLKNRSSKYPLKVTGVEELGILDYSCSEFTDPAEIAPDPAEPREKFIELVNKKLAISKKKDIYIYVHGYKVVFDNPLLVATELWNFLGYDGVFIAYAWPSTPKNLAYFSDLETAAMSSRFLRTLIEMLAAESNAENIHIIGYSAGTRVVINTLYQMALLHNNEKESGISKKLKLGHVILTGSDFDRQIFGMYLMDGLMDITRDFTIYTSKTDKAIGASRFIFRRERLGSMWRALTYLERMDNLRFIDATGAEGSDTGNGHAYFRKSPWVSSDILLTLMYDLTPEQRGLVRTPGSGVWEFPDDYGDKLSDRIKKANPELYK